MPTFRRSHGLRWCNRHSGESYAAVITGAAGGIGGAFGEAIARPGVTLHLIDTDESGLCSAAERLRATGANVKSHQMSVTDEGAMTAIARDLDQPLAYLITCAGVMHIGSARSSTLAHARRVIDTNLWGTITAATVFLPCLQAAGDAHFIAVSSGLGLMALPDYSAYSSSKYGIRGFAESLGEEVIGQHLTVTTVYPGCVRTPIIHRATTAPDIDLASRERSFGSLARTSATAVADRSLDAAHAGRARVVIGPDARAGDLVARLLPGTYQRVIARMLRQ